MAAEHRGVPRLEGAVEQNSSAVRSTGRQVEADGRLGPAETRRSVPRSVCPSSVAVSKPALIVSRSGRFAAAVRSRPRRGYRPRRSAPRGGDAPLPSGTTARASRSNYCAHEVARTRRQRASGVARSGRSEDRFGLARGDHGPHVGAGPELHIRSRAMVSVGREWAVRCHGTAAGVSASGSRPVTVVVPSKPGPVKRMPGFAFGGVGGGPDDSVPSRSTVGCRAVPSSRSFNTILRPSKVPVAR